MTRLGFTDPPAAVASGFASTRYVAYLRQNDRSPNRWDNLKVGQPSEYVYWYRQSPQRLTTDRWSLGGRITPTDPPHDVPGMVIVMVDPKGRLHQFVAVPPAQQPAAVRTPPDWSALFREAGLDVTTFTETTPTWTPPTYADARAAWDGVYPDNPHAKIHIEAASIEGRPTFFRIYQPWDRPNPLPSTTPTATTAILLGITVIVLVSAALLARRNIRLGRGDRVGATRLAVVLFVVHLSAGSLQAVDHLTLSGFIPTLTVPLARALWLSAIVWMTYVALEPDLRRRAPEMLIAWSRLLTGRFSDPLVGRSLLVGVTAGVVGQLLYQLQLLSPRWVGQAPDVTFVTGGGPASTVSEAVASLFGAWTAAVLVVTSLTFLLLLVLLVVRRRTWAGVALFVLVLVLSSIGRPLNVSMVFHVLNALLVILVLIRFGVLACVVSAYVNPVLDHVPMTFDSSVWYASQSWLALAVMVALAVVGYRIAVAGRPLVGSTWLDA